MDLLKVILKGRKKGFVLNPNKQHPRRSGGVWVAQIELPGGLQTALVLVGGIATAVQELVATAAVGLVDTEDRMPAFGAGRVSGGHVRLVIGNQSGELFLLAHEASDGDVVARFVIVIQLVGVVVG